MSGFGLNNVGLLVRVYGEVASLTADNFTIDDHTGRGPIKVLVSGVNLGNLVNGDDAAVTGDLLADSRRSGLQSRHPTHRWRSDEVTDTRPASAG